MNCDKCNRPVSVRNDATVYDAIRYCNPTVALYAVARHLLPVFENGERVCDGSPSRAQYLEGQPRDFRGYPYKQELEAPSRDAYLKMQEMEEPVSA
jgi:hypothetical protein